MAARESLFHAVVVMGVAMIGCDDNGARVPDEPLVDVVAPPQPSLPPEVPSPAVTAAAPTASSTAEPEPDDVGSKKSECPPGAEMPDPPCFYIL